MEATINQLLLAQFRNGLTELVALLSTMSPGQLQGLSQFVNANGWVPMNLAVLDATVRQTPDDQFASLLELGNRFLDGLVQQVCTCFQPSADGQSTITPEQKQQQEMLREATFGQLLKLFDILADKPQMEQLHLLDEFKTLLSQLDQETLQSLHSEISEISREEPGTEARHLPELITFESQHFYLYDPLRQLLQLPADQFLTLSVMLPQWGMIQLLLLTRLRDSGAFDVSDYTTLLVPEKVRGQETSTTSAYAQPTVALPLTQGPSALMLSILEQPPSKCVYKRNVKPAPTVVIEGDHSVNDGNLYIVPVLIRCDTLEEVPKLLTGNTPQKITATRTVAFKSLKILTTSHKLNETLFSLQFELRRYNTNAFEVIHRSVSNPILVLSHSTQLKASPKLLPTVTEVIPFRGPEDGGTRVAILGSGFCDSPTVRVKFDQIEVMPIFHGTKTLIVSTPQHKPGTVEVRVCNDLNSWSESAATFTYHGTTSTSPQTLTSASDFGFPSTPADKEHSFENASNNYTSQMNTPDPFGSPSGLDSSGFNTLHYAAAAGDLLQTRNLLNQGINPNIQDKHGNSALHWAISNSHCSIVLLLLSVHTFQQSPTQYRFQCRVNIRNEDGETPLHWAIREGNGAIAELLIKRGSDVNQQNYLGVSPLHVASAVGNILLVSLLLTYGAVHSATIDGLFPLHLASLGGHPEVVNKLLESDNRATIRATDGEGNTPLHCAVASGDLETVKALLAPALQETQAPSDLKHRSYLFNGSQRREQEALRRLLLNLENQDTEMSNQDEPRTPLQRTQGYKLRETPNNIDNPNSDGETPLLLALAFSYFEIAKLLIETGAKVNSSDTSKNTPAHAAIMSKDTEMVSVLIQSGADFHAPNSAGDTPYSLSLLMPEKNLAWMIPSNKRKESSATWNQPPSKRSKSLAQESPQFLPPVFDTQRLISVL